MGIQKLSPCFSPWDTGVGGTGRPPALQQRMLEAGDPHGPASGRFVLVTDPPREDSIALQVGFFFVFLVDQLVPGAGSAGLEAERGLKEGFLLSWMEKGLWCCPSAAAWSPARPAARPAVGLEGIGDKGDFWGCFSSCSYGTLILGELLEEPGVQHGSGVSRHRGALPVCPAEPLDRSLSQGGCSQGSSGKGN